MTLRPDPEEREVFVEVMRRCGMEDLSDAALDRCLRRAASIRDEAQRQGWSTEQLFAHASQFTSEEGGEDEIDHPDEEYSPRQQRPQTRAAPVAQPLAKMPAGLSRPAEPRAARRPFHHHATRYTKHDEMASTESVRGTPIIPGGPLRVPSRQSTLRKTSSPRMEYIDDPAPAPADTQKMQHDRDEPETQREPVTHHRSSTRQPLHADPAKLRTPGYMNTVYAEYLRTIADVAYAEDGVPSAAEPHTDFVKRPLTSRTSRRHQDRFIPPRADPPTTARATKKYDNDSASDHHHHDDDKDLRKTGADEPSLTPSRNPRVMSQVISSVIYGPLGSKTYLAGGFRPLGSANVAHPYLGAPRRMTDPVKRYAQMKAQWNRDNFLRSQRPEGQRRELRWAVRASMNDWRPEPQPL